MIQTVNLISGTAAFGETYTDIDRLLKLKLELRRYLTCAVTDIFS